MGKVSLGEISSIAHDLDDVLLRSGGARMAGVRPGFTIVKTFKKVQDVLEELSKTQSTIVRGGELQIFEPVTPEFGTNIQNVDLDANSGGTSNRAARADHHHHLDEDIAPTWTSPHAWAVPTAEITPAVGALKLTATLPATDMTGAGVPRAVFFDVTSPSGSGTPTSISQGIVGQAISLLPNYTGTAATMAGFFVNTVAGAGTSMWENLVASPGVGSNRGHYARASATTAGHNVGARNDAYGGAVNAGTATSSYQPKVSGINVGLVSLAYNDIAVNGKIGAFIGLYGPVTVGGDFVAPNLATMAANGGAGLIVDNGSQSANTPVARFMVGGTETARISRLGGLYMQGFNMGTGVEPILIDRNDSTTVLQIALRTANAATTIFGVDSAGRERQFESVTPTHVVNTGFHYAKQAASGRTEFYYFDSDGVSAGVETQLTANGSVNMTAANFANPSASVILTAVNGSATTAMRSDAAPPLSQAIAPTWTAQHIYQSTLDANSVILKALLNETTDTLVAHYWDAGSGTSEPWLALGAGDGATNFGMLKMGYLGSGNGVPYIQGKLNAVDAADSGKYGMTFDIATTLSSARAFRWTNTVANKDYFVIGPTGHIIFGYSALLAPETTTAVAMVGSTVNDSTLLVSFGTSLQHDNTAVTPEGITAVAGLTQVGQTTNVPTNGYAGIRGGVSILSAADSAGASGVEAASFVGQLGPQSYSGSFDRPIGASSLRGNWLRVSAFRGAFIGSKASGPGSTAGARPLILSSVYAPISPYVDGTTGQSWGIEIASPVSSNTPTITPIAGGIKITHPLKNAHANYATRGMHAYFLPYALALGGFSGNVMGDVSFDDGTNNQAGLYQYITAWGKILDDADVLVYDDEIVMSDDEFVYA